MTHRDHPDGRPADSARQQPQPETGSHRPDASMYWRLGIMLGVSLIWMYGAMFAMVRDASDADMNVNFFYMALLMAAPMGVFELSLMWPMYRQKRLNIVILSASLLLTVFSFLAIRSQFAVTDRRFLESMIPHHSGAILMCEEASLEDPRVKELCDGIIESQRAEIAEMEELLRRLD